MQCKSEFLFSEIPAPTTIRTTTHLATPAAKKGKKYFCSNYHLFSFLLFYNPWFSIAILYFTIHD